MPHYITTHNADGQAVYSDKASDGLIDRPFAGKDFGSTALLFSTHDTPSDPSTEADIKQYHHDREHGFEGGAICPPRGTCSMIATMAPGAATPMHRTMTTDTVVVIEGVVELRLDSGETRTLRDGDSLVQRATMHQYVNVTPNDGWVKMVAFAVATVDPVTVGGKGLSAEFKN